MAQFYKYILTGLAVFSGLSVMSAADVDFVNNPSDEDFSWWGTGKSEIYDMALYIAAPEFTGLEITAISFPIVADEAITDYTIWLSHELTLEDKINVPDIMSAPATVDGSVATVSLDSPYLLTDEGVYVGLSFNVTARETEEQKNPIAYIDGADSYGFYLHTSRTYTRWAERSENLPYSIPVTLTLSGVSDHAAALTLPAEINTGVGTPASIVAHVINRGASVIESMTFDYTADNGMAGSVVVDLPGHIEAGFNRASDVLIELPAAESTFISPLTVTAASVNSFENLCTEDSAVTTLNVWSHVPEHRPLMEEYTGMGCGWCPRGAIGIEKMRELYGDRFIAVAHHCDDELAIFDADSRPNHAPSQPVAWLDRWRETDPYNGDNTEVRFGIDRVWQSLADSFTPAEIEVSWDWTDETQETIKATSTVNFVKPFENADFRVAYMLVADGLSKDTWYQGNYYAGRIGEFPEEFDFLVNSPQYIFNVTFDDVVILADSPQGIEGSLPSTIVADEPMEYTATLNLADACSLSTGENLVQDKSRLNIVATVLDATTGRILNSAKSSKKVDAVNTVASDSTPVSVIVYDIIGCPVTTDYKGMAIKVSSFSDGTVKSEKTILR